MCNLLYYSNNNVKIALKIIKNVEKYREAAMLEISVLEKINSLDPEGHKLVVTLVVHPSPPDINVFFILFYIFPINGTMTFV